MIVSVGMGWAISASFMMPGDGWLELGIKKPRDLYGLGLMIAAGYVNEGAINFECE